jgi:hypothetical protein
MITQHQIENEFGWYKVRHGNKGYPRDEQGHVIMRPGGEEPYHRGYVWTFATHECPRLTFSDHIMHPDKPDWRVWAVDGEDVPDIAGAIAALSRPPLLSLSEYWAWLRLGPNPVGVENVVDIVAGCANPTPRIYHVGSRHSLASRAIDGLKSKGLIRYDEPTHSYWRVNK